MKKSFPKAFIAATLLSLVIILTGCGANGTKITILHEGLGKAFGLPANDLADAQIKREFPGVELEYIQADFADGSAKHMDAMIASGQVPDIYLGYAGRVSKYLKPGFALNLNGTVTIDNYNGSILQQLSRGGQLLALPGLFGAQALCVNQDILDSVGYVIPDNWTVNDYLALGAKIKAKYGKDKYLTMLFAANQSGSYLVNQWIFTMGAKLYDGGYSQSAFNDQSAVASLQFIKELYDLGYIPDNAPSLNDDDYCAQWAEGKLATAVFFAGWLDGYFKTAIEQGKIKSAPNVRFVEMPRLPGIAKVPVHSSFPLGMGIDKKNALRTKIVKRYLSIVFGSEWQKTESLLNGNYSFLKTVPNLSLSPYIKQIADVVAEHGSADEGLTSGKYAVIRPIFPELLQRLWKNELAPDAFVQEYTERVNKILGE